MTAAMGIAGGVVVFIAVVWILVSVSKKAGASTARVNTLREGERRREDFDNASRRPLAFGRALVNRLRDLQRNR